MKIAKITAEIYASTEDAAYRVYINDTLMTERTFIWPPRKHYVEEQMIIDGDTDTDYTVRVVSLKETATFTLKNVTVDGKKTEATFRI